MHNTLSDLYLFANNIEFGITPTAPILTRKELDDDIEDVELLGVVALDVKSGGPISDFFHFDSNIQPVYMLFNSANGINSERDVAESEFRNKIE